MAASRSQSIACTPLIVESVPYGIRLFAQLSTPPGPKGRQAAGIQPLDSPFDAFEIEKGFCGLSRWFLASQEGDFLAVIQILNTSTSYSQWGTTGLHEQRLSSPMSGNKKRDTMPSTAEKGVKSLFRLSRAAAATG
ncbi:MAG: hypothetical protein RKP46_07600 [Candidatus Accumulibacter sp.]|uniref:hypothetical protein n=1 Tax=Accumulibacter sp. TaxID=2053492 RepID=UPI0028791FCC|nr:hypothetical protein [Accumulibacter sp.]MDS4014209.1 hypothetical protein [Accumulibacter sp.]